MLRLFLTAPSHLRSPVQNTETGKTSLVYQAEIITAVPSDHEYGDKHGHNLLDFEK